MSAVYILKNNLWSSLRFRLNTIILKPVSDLSCIIFRKRENRKL